MATEKREKIELQWVKKGLLQRKDRGVHAAS